jgi:hypothetical protein
MSFSQSAQLGTPKEKDVLAGLKVDFSTNYGQQDNAAFRIADTALTGLLARGEHQFVFRAVKENLAGGMHRPTKISLFLRGQAADVEKGWPAIDAAPVAIGEKFATAVSAYHVGIVRTGKKVGSDFWKFAEEQTRKLSPEAARYQQSMFALIVLVEAFNEGATLKAEMNSLRQFLQGIFGQLPPAVWYKFNPRPVDDRPRPAKPAVTTNVVNVAEAQIGPVNNILKIALDAALEEKRQADATIDAREHGRGYNGNGHGKHSAPRPDVPAVPPEKFANSVAAETATAQ